ncbi:MAG: cytochrome c-type biogenesis protein CcmH [Rhodanobacteraceae bacterium]|nr:cytochrome c-type biogenesis protein CcmH [Rhodanobacteraceae bacterium]MBK7043337.1 cytochrome c-type biogenesis protein CcmH [Rhodanobacteraceae bacterium]MBP9155162.1 cytochrome c-type biogenesis protein CcmH [Xanthomonadales bacterium]
MMLRPLFVLIFLLFVPFAQAIDPLPFANDAEEQRFQHLASELRCLVCQNQNIADSDAGLAKDLRKEVFEMMRAGQSDDEIKRFLTDRYGDFVLYRPPFKSTTLVLWIGPIVILVIGFAIARNMMLRSGPHPDLPGPIDDKVDR